MRFDVYGRCELEVLRENDAWVAYHVGAGKRSRDGSIVIPDWLAADEIAGYLDDLFHELSGPGESIRRIS